MRGGTGTDWLLGGAGSDTLYGDGTTLATADIFFFDVFGSNGADHVKDFDIAHDILDFQGVGEAGDAGVTVGHTANGWLQLNFAGGGSVDFVGNEQLANVNTMAQLNNLVEIHYDDWNQ